MQGQKGSENMNKNILNIGKKKKSEKSAKRSEKAEKPQIDDKKESESESNDRFAAFMDEEDLEIFKDDYFESNYGYSASDDIGSTSKPKKSAPEKTASKANNNDYKTPRRPKANLTREQRRLIQNLRYFLVFFIIVGIAVFLSFQLLFRTSEIQVVNGDKVPYTDAQIIEVSGLKLKENIFTSKKKLAVKKITEEFPFIEDASVSFKIPATQIITVEPAVPSYYIAVSEGFAKISANARVLEITKEQDMSIPLLRGLKMNNAAVGEYITFEKAVTQQILSDVIDSIHENNVPNIYGIDISNAAGIKLNYDNRITILLGLHEDVRYKLKTAMTIINTELTPADKGDLDVSLANGNRKASYFTPVTTNTVSVAGSSSQQSTSSTSSNSNSSRSDDYYEVPPTTLRPVISQAESSQPDTEKGNEDNNDENDYFDDYYYEDDQQQDYYENEQPDQNINDEYGTNYY